MIRCPVKSCRSTRVVVVSRNCNFSAFNGYHRTASDYSGLRCLDCRTPWRSKAKGVDNVPDATRAELDRLYGQQTSQPIDAPVRREGSA